MCGFNKMGPPLTLPEPQWRSSHVPCSQRGDVPWPPRSPNLSMCDFFLWGYLKSRVYEGKQRTLELKGAIRKQIGMINQELLERVEANFRERLQMCILQNGHYLSDIIFRT